MPNPIFGICSEFGLQIMMANVMNLFYLNTSYIFDVRVSDARIPPTVFQHVMVSVMSMFYPPNYSSIPVLPRSDSDNRVSYRHTHPTVRYRNSACALRRA